MSTSNIGSHQQPAAALLGCAAEAKLLTINCDDLGMDPATNEAVLSALLEGRATSATLIVPATHAAAAADDGQHLPIGIHLTLNSEWKADRWGPLTAATSLRDADGMLYRAPQETVARADAVDVEAEWRAQIEQAWAWGLDPTHLDSHMYIAQERPDFFEIYLDLAAEYRLPVRVSGSARQHDHPFRARARARGVICPDYLVKLGQVGSRPELMAALTGLSAGVTEFHLHPAVDSAELRELASDWQGRVDDDVLLLEPEFWGAIDAAGAELVSYRDLRDAARNAPPTP